MKRITGVLLALVLAAGSAPGQEKMKAMSEYFPLQEGTTWTYKSGNDTYETKVAGYEKVGEEMCAKLETSCNGKVVATEHIGIRKDAADPTGDGIYRCAFAGSAPTKPLRILKLPPGDGDTWESNTRLLNEEVKVTFKLSTGAVRVEGGNWPNAIVATSEPITVGRRKVVITTYFVEKVGIVKKSV